MARDFTTLGAFAKRKLNRLSAIGVSTECDALLESNGINREAFVLSPKAAILSLSREQLLVLARLETPNQLRALAREVSWSQGWAQEWALDDGKKEWREAFLSTEPLSTTVWNIGRQRGKTFAAVFLALETGASKTRAVIRYCAKTKDSAVSIVGPAWSLLSSSMRDAIRPRQGRTDYEWVFPSTGATFVLFGTDAQSFGRGRGPRTDLQLLDECGFYQDLSAVESALLPSLQTTGGRALYLSTPAESVGHPYTARIYAAQAAGRYQHGTFWDNPRVNHEAVIEAERTRLGMARDVFLASTYFRREFKAEIVTDESRAAMPAWNYELSKLVVGEWERPKYFDAYEGLDLGRTGDPHAWLAAYYDYSTSIVTIEDELELRSASHTVRALADAIKEKERALYGLERWNGTLMGAKDFEREFGVLPEYLRNAIADDAPQQPYLRVGDNDGMVLATLNAEQGLAVIPTAKQDKHLAVDAANQLLATHRVRIHKRCVRLLEQLYSAVWNKARSAWEKTDKDHSDLIDCLVYILRNIRWHRDSRPVVVAEGAKNIPTRALPYEMQRKATRFDALRGRRL